MESTQLERMIGSQEQVLWKGVPDKKCFIFESIFNPMLFFALIWGGFDLFFIGMSVMADGGSGELGFLFAFMLIHMMPVWLYIGGIITTGLRFRNIQYIITDRGIYVSSGLFTTNCEMKPFTDLSHVNIHRGIFDQYLDVGDVIIECNHNNMGTHHDSGNHGIAICNIPDYERVHRMISELQTNVYADTMFPNMYRPGMNYGYQTQYMQGNPNMNNNPNPYMYPYGNPNQMVNPYGNQNQNPYMNPNYQNQNGYGYQNPYMNSNNQNQDNQN